MSRIMDGYINLRGILWALILLGFVGGFAGNESRNFIQNSNRRLGVGDNNQENNVLIKKGQVVSQLMCAHWCLQTSSCASFNLEKKTAKNGNNRSCELLSVSEIQRPDLFQEDMGFDYYTSAVYLLDIEQNEEHYQERCNANSCQNNGTCVEANSTVYCVCEDGYEGSAHCENTTATERCNVNSCQNNGTCLEANSTIYCVCNDGYEGAHCEIISECVHYHNLTEADRNIKYGMGIKTFDGPAVITTGQWYRITGPAGSRMLDSCPTSGACNADFHGWIDSQPNPGEVRAQRTVRKKSTSSCNNYPQQVLATNCGDFNVYKLKSLNMYVRYCGTD